MLNRVGRMGPLLAPSLASSVKRIFSFSCLSRLPSPTCHLHLRRFFSYSCLPPPPPPTCHLLFCPKEEEEGGGGGGGLRGEKESDSDNTTDDDADDVTYKGILSLKNNYRYSLNLAEKKVLMVDGTKSNCSNTRATPLFINNNRLQEYFGDSRCLGSSCGWILLAKPEDCSLYLLNPFFPNPPVIPLPPLESLPHVFSTLRQRVRHSSAHNNSSSSSSLFAMDFTISTRDKPVPSDKFMLSGRYPMICDFTLSSSPFPCCSLSSNASAAAAATTHPKNDDYIVVICCVKTLAFCRPGDAAWTVLTNGEFLRIGYWRPVFSHDKKTLYVLSCEGLLVWDLTDLSSPKLAFEKKYLPGSSTEYLVGSSTITMPGGGLLRAVRRTIPNKGVQDKGTATGRPAVLPYSTIGFELREFQFSANTIESKVVEDLGDNVLLLDYRHSTLVSARDFPELKPNSIYFVDDNDDNYNGHDMGVYSIKDSTISPFFPPPYDSMKIQARATWVIPSLS